MLMKFLAIARNVFLFIESTGEVARDLRNFLDLAIFWHIIELLEYS